MAKSNNQGLLDPLSQSSCTLWGRCLRLFIMLRHLV
jgi:hypothetical protein